MESIRFRLRFFLVALVVIVALGTFGFMIIEGLPLLDAFYFSIVTIATVGYGDVHATTPAGKGLTILLIVLGVGTFLGVVANATEMMLNRRENQARLKKINMLIGIFFSEVGTKLLSDFSDSEPGLPQIRKELVVTGRWTDEDFLRVSKMLKSHRYEVDIGKLSLEGMKDFLLRKRAFLVGLLESPMLLEHEAFTELLRAVFHLVEELGFREDVLRLPDSDRAHLSGDARRAYNHMVHQWLDYMRYLKEHYPYLFSLAMRTNPFDQEASPVVEEVQKATYPTM